MGYYFLIKVPKSPGGGQLHNLNPRLLHSVFQLPPVYNSYIQPDQNNYTQGPQNNFIQGQPILNTDFKGSQFSKFLLSKFGNLGVAWRATPVSGPLIILKSLNRPIQSNCFLYYIKASVNAHNRTKILKNHVKSKISLNLGLYYV